MRILTFSAVLFFTFIFSTQLHAKDNYPLPHFTQTAPQSWLNSKPLTKKDVLGKVTLIDFWTFDCWNCYRSFPWLHGIQKQYKSEGFQMIGIHSPEFEHEKSLVNVEAKVKEFKITNPVMIDNDMGFWIKMKNRFWPSYYIVDKRGQVRANFIGETHEGSAQAKKIEALIETLLAEK